MTRWCWVLALALGCPPTLSRPRSDAFLDHLATGERHAHHGRDVLAAEEFARATESADRRVDRDEARYRRARALEDAGEWRSALSEFDVIAAGEPVSRRTARASLDAARLRLRHDHERALAIEGLRRVVLRFPDSGSAGRALYWLLREHDGDPLQMLEALYAEIGQSALGDNLLAAIAERHADADDRVAERATLERIVAEHPYPQGHLWDEAVVRLAAMDVEDGRPLEAIARLTAMLERAETTSLIGSYTLPSFPPARLQIARLHRQMGDLEAAAASFARLEDDFPTSILRDDARVEAGEMWLEAGERERGCDLLRSAVETFEVGRARRRAAARLSEC